MKDFPQWPVNSNVKTNKLMMGNIACVHTAHCVVSSKHLEASPVQLGPRKATGPPWGLFVLFDLFHSSSNFILELKFWNFEISEHLYNVRKQTSRLGLLDDEEWCSFVELHFTMFPGKASLTHTAEFSVTLQSRSRGIICHASDTCCQDA